MTRAGAENKNDEEAEDEGTGPWRLQLEVDDVRVDFPVQHHYPAEEEQGQLMAGVRAIATGAPAARRDGLLRVGAAARDDGAADAVDAAMEEKQAGEEEKKEGGGINVTCTTMEDFLN